MMIRLSDHFSCGRLLRFTLPTIAMMILHATILAPLVGLVGY